MGKSRQAYAFQSPKPNDDEEESLAEHVERLHGNENLALHLKNARTSKGLVITVHTGTAKCWLRTRRIRGDGKPWAKENKVPRPISSARTLVKPKAMMDPADEHSLWLYSKLDGVDSVLSGIVDPFPSFHDEDLFLLFLLLFISMTESPALALLSMHFFEKVESPNVTITSISFLQSINIQCIIRSTNPTVGKTTITCKINLF